MKTNISQEYYDWRSEFPTEPGVYWFWGHRFKGDEEERLLYVTVKSNSSGNIFVIANDNFMFKSEVGKGLFAKINLDFLPSAGFIPND